MHVIYYTYLILHLHCLLIVIHIVHGVGVLLTCTGEYRPGSPV